MGIAPYKTFTFDGESSGDYGVYITGTGVFNAPERSVEMIEIAGRNGSFALDKGKFENIEVTYRVGIVDDSESDFADRVSDFRNWLCSKVGYCRLEDEYNPNEYRMAVYSSGIEIEHDLLIAGEAEITFNCKPQRWLTSGETAVSVADGGTLDNPTRFESEPLLAVEGYGNINFNGYDIDIENVVLGDVLLANAQSINVSVPITVQFNNASYNNGDTITLGSFYFYNRMYSNVGESGSTSVYTNLNYSNTNLLFSTTSNYQSHNTNRSEIIFNTTTQAFTFTAGTAQTVTNTVTITGKQKGTNFTITETQTIEYIPSYSQGVDAITMDTSVTYSSSQFYQSNCTGKNGKVTVYSTLSALGNPTYIDCDIGECYMYKDGEIVTLNNVIDLGSDLPRLVSGTNTINYDNTITSLEVTPRWWKV